MHVNFISSKDTGETHIIYVLSYNEDIMQGSEAYNIIKELFETLLDNYQKEEQIIRGSDFVFESVRLMAYKIHKVGLKRGGSYIESPKWLVNKKAAINPKNIKDDKCFQYAIVLSLSYNEIKKKQLENIFKKTKREDINFSSHQRVWKHFEQSNESIALNVLFSSQNNEEIGLVYGSGHNFKRENNAVLLMINDSDDTEKNLQFGITNKTELFSSKWLRSKKEEIINGDNSFQNALNDALDYQRIKRNPQRISKTKPYISQYNWKDIEFPSHKKDWKKFEQNNSLEYIRIST